jgi:pyridoxamine 5'-phosphate oxidase
MAEHPPPYYNDLRLSLAEAQSMVDAGAKDRRRAAHCPVVATIDGKGVPSQRIMILRAVDWHQRQLRFHTDLRSSKVREANGDAVSVLFYEPDAKIQLRLTGRGVVAPDGAETDAAWNGSTLFARRCYMAKDAPGMAASAPVSGLPDWIEGQQPTADDIAPARPNFAALLVHFDSIEWLYLANCGHRRARWQWDEAAQDWHGSWLIP